jgi:hypothetical protein
MSEKPEALRLADDLDAYHTRSCHKEAAAELRRLHAENASLAAALASSCDEARDQIWESGGVAGCSRALSAEFQRDALLAEHQQTLALQQRSYEREIRLEVEAEIEAAEERVVELFAKMKTPYLPDIINAIRARTP